MPHNARCPEHHMSESSTTVAIGPGVVDFLEWEYYYHETHQSILYVKDENIRAELRKMFENVQTEWLKYSQTSLNYHKHNERLYKKYEEAKTTFGKYLMLAGLSG